MNKKIILFLAAIVFFGSCLKNQIENQEDGEITMESLNVSADFDYKTTTQIDFLFEVNSNEIQNLGQKTVAVYNTTNGDRIFKGVLDANGKIAATLTIPTYLNDVSVITSIPGISNVINLAITNGKVSYVYNNRNKGLSLEEDGVCSLAIGQFRTQTMGAWGNAKGGNAGSSLLYYFDDVFPNGIVLGCGNTITFTTAQAVVDFLPGGGPSAQLTKSFVNPTKKLGNLSGQLLAVTIAAEFSKYGVPAFGNSSTLLGDLIISTGDFEGWTVAELLAEANTFFGSCEVANDKDYITALATALDNINKNFDDGTMDLGFLECPANNVPDCDNDGVPDSQDEYPCDPEKTFNNYAEGTLVYEDLWPSKGDFDFNDLVIDYTYNVITNSDNKATYLDADFQVRAIGASFQNGFAFELDIDPSQIASVEGANLAKNYITLSPNGTESGQSKAVITVFDNAFSILPHPGAQQFINTVIGETYAEPKSTSVSLRFENPVAVNELGELPYNAFIIKDGNRNEEVHLADKEPTDLVDASVFGTGDDVTNPSAGVFYKTSNNLPWALHFPEIVFEYPTEKTAIVKGYLKFKEWAESNGTLSTDWYINTSSDYRDQSFIFQK